MEIIGQDKVNKVMPHSHTTVSIPTVQTQNTNTMTADAVLENRSFSSFQNEDTAFVRKVGESVLTTLVGEFLGTLKTVKQAQENTTKSSMDTVLKLVADLAPALVPLFKPPTMMPSAAPNPYTPQNIALLNATQDMLAKQALTQQRIMTQDKMIEQRKLEAEQEIAYLQEQKNALEQEFNMKVNAKLAELDQLKSQIVSQIPQQPQQQESLSGTVINQPRPLVANPPESVVIPKAKFEEIVGNIQLAKEEEAKKDKQIADLLEREKMLMQQLQTQSVKLEKQKKVKD